LFSASREHLAVLGAAVALASLAAAGCNGARAGSATPAPPAQAARTSAAFDGEKAFALLKRQCDFGPRPVGSQAHQRARDFLLEEMRRHADRATTQDFAYRGMPLTNVIGLFNESAQRRVLLCAHWDTRPRADQEIDPARQKQPIPGANDGASGVAVLLELARIFKERRPAVGVVIVLFDGEDYGDFQRDEGVFLGSRHFARNCKEFRAEYGILLDMVGDRDLDIYREGYSDQYATSINRKVFAMARELGFGRHIIDEPRYTVQDDHIPLNTIARIPTIDLIDFNYGPWHTLDDTPDKCSPRSLQMVGSTIAEVVRREPAG